MNTTQIKTSGTHCPSCTMLIELTVGDLDGVAEVTSDHAGETTTVQYDPARTSPETVAEAIRTAGYGAEIIA
jgi:copper chaperone CopZ